MENILLDTAGPTARIRVIVPHEAKLANMTSANFTVRVAVHMEPGGLVMIAKQGISHLTP
jgi:hypothetical protein